MSTYLDIIRPYRRDRQGRPPDPAPPSADPSRDSEAGVTRYPDAGRTTPGGRWMPRVEDMLKEIDRPGSGPAKALGTYLEKPNAERLGWLTKAVLRSLAMGTDGWERYVPVVAEAATKVGNNADESKET